MKLKILAESGGSKTSWCVENEGLNFDCMEGLSLHPKYWDDLENRLPAAVLGLIKEKYELLFYGAGCFQKNKQEELQQKFQHLGFSTVRIKGDVDAAAQACLGKKSGWVAILGSGSVLCRVEEGEVVELFGGNGEIDDFGSGYRFGRLLQAAISNNERKLSSKEQEERVKIATTKEEYLELSAIVDSSETFEIHLRNVGAFIEKLVLPNIKKSQTLHFVGSYAYFHRPVVEQCLGMHAIIPGKFVAKPIEELKKLK